MNIFRISAAALIAVALTTVATLPASATDQEVQKASITGYAWQPSELVPAEKECTAVDANNKGNFIAHNSRFDGDVIFIRNGKEVLLHSKAEGITFTLIEPQHITEKDIVYGAAKWADANGNVYARLARWSPDGKLSLAPNFGAAATGKNFRVISSNTRGDVLFSSDLGDAVWWADGRVALIPRWDNEPTSGSTGITDDGTITNLLGKPAVDVHIGNTPGLFNEKTGWRFVEPLPNNRPKEKTWPVYNSLNAISPNGKYLVGRSIWTPQPAGRTTVLYPSIGGPATAFVSEGDYLQRIALTATNRGNVLFEVLSGDHILWYEIYDISHPKRVEVGRATTDSTFRVQGMDDRGRLFGSVTTNGQCRVGFFNPQRS